MSSGGRVCFLLEGPALGSLLKLSILIILANVLQSP